MKSIIKKRIIGLKWNKRWTEEQHGKFTKIIMPTVRNGKVKYHCRGALARITRLRLGNPYFIAKRDEICDSCNQDKTIEHVLLECPTHDRQREKVRNIYRQFNLDLSIFNLLNTKAKGTIEKANLDFINSIEEPI